MIIRYIIFGLLFFILTNYLAFAATVTLYLKNGRKVQGNLISEDSARIKLEVGGIPYTYYRDEIAKIDDGRVTGPVPLAELVDRSLRAVENIPPSKRDLIFRLMDANGTRASMGRIFAQILKDIPAESAATFNEIFKVDEVLLRLVPIYDKYYTDEELKELITFYRSPVGRKVIETIPSIMQEAMMVSANYFKERIPENLLSTPSSPLTTP